MFASTKVAMASFELPAMPFVATVIAAPPTASVADACPVTVPAVLDVNVIVHCPLASVFAPALVQVPVGAVWAAPLASVSVTATCSPDAGTNVPFVSLSSVTVNVCDVPTSCVSFGTIVIFALAHSFVASMLSPALPSFDSRCSATPPTLTSVAAQTFVVPVVAELIVTVQEPVPPDVLQVAGPMKPPGPETIEKLIVVPFGAFTKPPPVPALTLT